MPKYCNFLKGLGNLVTFPASEQACASSIVDHVAGTFYCSPSQSCSVILADLYLPIKLLSSGSHCKGSQI